MQLFNKYMKKWLKDLMLKPKWHSYIHITHDTEPYVKSYLSFV